jgi:hypothetical protein
VNYIVRGIEIKEQIDHNNRIIEAVLSPNKFTLNNIIATLLQENSKLQQQCEHDFEEGFCVYCYKSKE